MLFRTAPLDLALASLRALALGLALALTPLTGAIVSAQAEDFSKTDIEKIVRDYLVENPEIIRDAMQELERRETAAAEAARIAAVSDSEGILFNSTRQVVLGNPEGDVTLVEFFDYNCGFCKRAYGDMVRLIEEDKNLRIVLKEFPVLGQGSVEAAQVAVAVNDAAPEKYAEFHEALLLQRGQANRASAVKAALEAGISEDALNTALATDSASQTIEEVYALANQLGLTGTPSYVVGDEVVMGAVGYNQLKSKISAMRNCGQTSC